MDINRDKTRIYGGILAGGSAARLGGKPKGLLDNSNGTSIIGGLINACKSAGIDQVAISANTPDDYKHYGCKVLPDKHLQAGPLAGIESILHHFHNTCDAVLIMPCDMPAITEKEIQILKKAFLASDLPIAVAAEPDTLWHPLSLIIANGYANEISDAISAGTRKVSKVWRMIGAETVIFDDPAVFENLNTPRDIQAWKKKCEA